MEKYEFTWPGKREAIIEASLPITKTLRPVKEDSRNWDTTENLYIEGDNLEVLKLLQENYLGKVKMIYIDPPYNTGSDRFVYPDSYMMGADEYEDGIGFYDENGNRNFMENNSSDPRFHSKWCSMVYQRLMLARSLLSENGFIFISIDDNEMDSLKKMCDEVFGLSNHCGTFVINSTPNARDYGHIGKIHEFCLFYAKNITKAESNMLPDESKTFKYHDKNGGYNIHPLYNSNEAFHKLNRPNLYYPFYIYLDRPLDKGFFEIGLEKKEHSVEVYPPKSLKNGVQFIWRWGKEKALQNMNEEIIGYEVKPGEYRIVQKMRHEEKIIRSLLTDTKYSSRRGTAEVEDILNGKIFSFPKPLSLIMDFCKVALSSTDIVLDFFSGSATTAHAVMQLNAEDGGQRKFIMVQLPEPCDEKSEAFKAGYQNICEIGKERIRRAGDKIKAEHPDADLDIGFRVFRVDESNMKEVYYHPEEIIEQPMKRYTKREFDKLSPKPKKIFKQNNTIYYIDSNYNIYEYYSFKSMKFMLEEYKEFQGNKEAVYAKIERPSTRYNEIKWYHNAQELLNRFNQIKNDTPSYEQTPIYKILRKGYTAKHPYDRSNYILLPKISSDFYKKPVCCPLTILRYWIQLTEIDFFKHTDYLTIEAVMKAAYNYTHDKEKFYE